MIIIQLWEWVVNIFILGCAAIIWAIALFMIGLLASLLKDFIMEIIGSKNK